METLDVGQIRFRIHSADAGADEHDTHVSAAVFAEKLGALVRALKAADLEVNGKKSHDYLIAQLKSSSPTALLYEVPLPNSPRFGLSSGIGAFDACANSIVVGDAIGIQKYRRCASSIARLAQGAEKKFGYGEVWTANDNIIRIDPFLAGKASEAGGVEKQKKTGQISNEWFRGTAEGSFIGELRAVDLRGALPSIKLVLSAGGKQIDGICSADDVEAIRSALNHRVRISGQAIYDGRSGLPARVQIRDISIIEPGVDFTRWKGTVERLASNEWIGDDH